MWIEFGTLIVTTMLSVTGVGLPQLALEPAAAPMMSCATHSTDSCLASDSCDVFIGAGGDEVCGLACDMRSLDSCTMDANCAVINGACDYADAGPVGC